MRTIQSLVMAAFALPMLLLLAPAPQAHVQEPAYLHAISDLRSARAYLQMDNRPKAEMARQHAIEQITRAIDDMKVAARDDGKNPWHTPRRRAAAMRDGRFTPPSGC